MSVDRFVLKTLLHVDSPWSVQDYRFDPGLKRLNLVIGREPARSWFGLGRHREDADCTEYAWRHVNIAGWHTHVRLRLPDGMSLPDAAWCGDAQHPFTRGLAQRVFVLFNEGLTLRSICTVLDLPLDEVWRYRFALDSGRTSTPANAPAAGTVSAKATPQAARQAMQEEPHHDGIPDPGEPVWLALLEGRLELDIRLLSLKLLLTKMRTQLDVIRDDEVRMLKLRELHRYFVKNARTLTYELEQIRNH